VVFSGQPDYQNPYSQQAEFGVEAELALGLSLSTSYIYVHTLHLPRAVDTNLLSGAPLLPTGPAGIPIRRWNAPACTAVPTNCFANPLLLQGNVYTSSANAVYHAGILELKKNFSHHFSLMLNYTWSKALDDATDYNGDYEAFDQTNLAAERARSDFDQRHKLVFAGVFQSPWKGGSNASLHEKIFSGFTVSPIVRYTSGRPFNLLAGSDVNGDRHSTTDRPPGAGRNTGLGPSFFTWDMRVARQFKLNERAALALMVESFNITNRTNFAQVNNTVGVIGPPFNLSGVAAPLPSTPLAFTSAYPKREVQFGMRLTF